MRYYVGLTANELFLLTLGSMIGAAALLSFFPEEGLWVTLGISFTMFVLGQMCLMAMRTVILPELIAFVACIQWIVAPWLSYRFPPTYFLYVMNVPPSEYFSFMVPAAVVLWAGLHLTLRMRGNTSGVPILRLQLPRQERRFWDTMIAFGFFMMLVSSRLPQGLRFLYFILAQFRFVGAFALMFTAAPGWMFRMAFVYVTLLMDTSAGGVFYELVLWSGYLFISLAYIRRWRWKLLIFLAAAITVVVMLNNIKMDYRQEIWHRSLTKLESVKLLGRMMLGQEISSRAATPASQQHTIGDRIVRYNQGWIISRVLTTVPSYEPFARGYTIVEGIKASLVPRILYKSKIESGSREFFKKYTNLNLGEGTSMALGIAGEMYVNFGRTGGLAAMLLYGMLIGRIFSWFARRAKTNVVWWAWAPAVLLTATEAEWNFVEVLNNIVKSLMVMFVLVYFVPVLKRRMLTRS